MKSRLAISLAAATVVGGCAGWDGFWQDLCGTPVIYSHRAIPIQEMPAFPRHCLGDDSELLARSQCQVDNAACYQLDTGNWCTGARPAQCPGDSVPIALEAECPAGFECWMYSTSLRCRSA